MIVVRHPDHNWQFVKIYEETEPDGTWKYMAQFICECGTVRIVEPTSDVNEYTYQLKV